MKNCFKTIAFFHSLFSEQLFAMLFLNFLTGFKAKTTAFKAGMGFCKIGVAPFRKI